MSFVLKIQNRTPNDDGQAAVDVNNVNYIQGVKYIGTGTGAYYKDVRVATTAQQMQPFIASKVSGIIKRTDLPVSQPSLLTPPMSARHFINVNKAYQIAKFLPGGTKISILKYSRRIKYTHFVDSWLKELNSETYVLSTLGKFAFLDLLSILTMILLISPSLHMNMNVIWALLVLRMSFQLLFRLMSLL